MTTLSPTHAERIEDAILELLQLEASHKARSSTIINIASHYVEIRAHVVDAQPMFLNLALDLLNAPAAAHGRAIEKFAEVAPDGTRAQCRKYVRWVRSELAQSS